MEDSGSLTFQDAVEVLKDLASEHYRTTHRHLDSIVVIGGTALAARGVRDRSDDIDIFARDIDDAVIEKTVARQIKRFGPRFKIDATPSNTIWGTIALLDIETSPEVTTIATDGRMLRIQALTVETLYLVKSAANRAKDRPDVRALAGKTTYEALLKRARQVFPWYSDRTAFPEQAERLSRHMARDFRVPHKAYQASLISPAHRPRRVRARRSRSTKH